MAAQMEYLENNTFVIKVNELNFEFFQLIYFGEEGAEYLLIRSMVAYQDWMKVDLLDEITKSEAEYPFAACYHVFKGADLGDEDWNRVFENISEVKKYFKDVFSVDYDELTKGAEEECFG